MRSKVLVLFLLVTAVFAVAASGQTPAFTYQGRLTDTTVPANGTYAMKFSLWDTAVGGVQQGTTITNTMVSVVNGVFTVELDFSPATPFATGAGRWIQLEVQGPTEMSYTTLTPRQKVTSAPYSTKAASASSADNATNATNVTGVVAIANGGTGSATGDAAGLNNLNASNLASGTVNTARLGSGTANSTTFLRGDNTWAAGGGTITGSGTTNYVPKFTSATAIGNSQIQDNGTTISLGIAPVAANYAYFYRSQLTATGDGQATLHGYRTRDSQNDGTGYGQTLTNSAVKGYNFWGDVYTFGVSGYGYNDYSRTGGVLGAEVAGVYWGSMGYRSSALVNYGVFGSSAYASGGGLNPTADKQGIGGGFYGGMIGSWSRGEVMGQVNSGEVFASYNLGNVYTSGFSADMVSKKGNAGEERIAAYAVTSPQLKVYDNGSAQMDGSSVFVPFSASYADMLGTVPDVTVSPVGSPAQLYIKSVGTDGFTVAVASGTAKVRFSWIAVGNRVDSGNAAPLPAEIRAGQFDSQLKDVMFNDGNLNDSGKAIWWDGNKVRFDKAPEVEKGAKVEVKPNN